MYTGWNTKVEMLRGLQWYSHTNLTSYLNNLRRYIMRSAGNASPAGNALPSGIPQLQASCPVTKNDRFPEHEAYFCEGYGDIGLLLSHLQLIVGITTSMEKLIRFYPEITSPGQADLAALAYINTIMQGIHGMENVYTRQHFEAKYCLHWEDAEPSPEN